MLRIVSWISLLSIIAFPSFAVDLSDLEEEEESVPGVEVQWSGLMDFRFAATGTEVNWAEASGNWGGRGLTRYGASRGGNGNGLGFRLAQISLVAEVNIMNELAGFVQLNISDHKDRDEDWGGPGIVEAYLSDQISDSVSTRVGFLIPHVSLEHPDVAWSTRYTITPSAINSWMGEEVRGLGAELRWDISENWHMIGALFSHNDTVATVITYRGWAMHDYQGTWGNRLRWNEVPAAVNQSNSWAEPFEEQDDRLGYWGKLAYSNSSKKFKAEGFFYDNRADAQAFDGSNYGWDTQFAVLSLDYQFDNGLKLMSQGLSGSTEMGGAAVVNADFWAGYFLATYAWGRHRVSARYDQFAVIDKNSATNLTDDNSRGEAGTFAYIFSRTDHQMIGVEYVMVKSERNGNENKGDEDPDDNLFQIMYRLKF